MTVLTHAIPLTYRVQASFGLVGRILCEYLNWHVWSRWERMTGIIKENGRNREVLVQGRECLRCGYGDVKLLR